jgi:glutathione S-transferase
MFDVHALRAAYRPLEQLFRGVDALTPPERARAASAPGKVHEELIVWEHKLQDHDFIAGDALTLADCVVYPVLAYMVRRGLKLEQHPGLASYVARMSARPASRDAHPEGWTRPAGKMDLFARASELDA